MLSKTTNYSTPPYVNSTDYSSHIYVTITAVFIKWYRGGCSSCM